MSLIDIINTKHENIKYFPNIKLPHILIAKPILLEWVEDVDIIIFNNSCLVLYVKWRATLNQPLEPFFCLKGFEVGKKGVQLLTSFIEEELNIPYDVLSGANLAPEVAKKFC